MISRKLYIQFARALATVLENPAADMKTIELAVDELNTVFFVDNQRFDAGKFADAVFSAYDNTNGGKS